jgi:sugar phosphate permease
MLISFYHGPITAVIHDVVPKHAWATAFGVYLLVAHLLGDTLSPAVIGAFSDKYSLAKALQWSTWLVLLSGLSFLIVCFLIETKKTD